MDVINGNRCSFSDDHQGAVFHSRLVSQYFLIVLFIFIIINSKVSVTFPLLRTPRLIFFRSRGNLDVIFISHLKE